MVRRLNAADPSFAADFEALLFAKREIEEDVAQAVRGLIADVRRRGDAALVELTNKFDRAGVTAEQLATLAKTNAYSNCLNDFVYLDWALPNANKFIYATNAQSLENGISDAAPGATVVLKQGKSFAADLVLDQPIINGAGRVRVRDSIWQATGPDLPAGAHVKVTGVLDTATLKVEGA